MTIKSANAKWGMVLLALLGGSCLSSCGSIIHGRTQTIPVSTHPAGATVYVDGRVSGFTPTSVTIARNRSHIITIAKEGYEDEVVRLQPRLSGAVCGNVVEGAALGIAAGYVCMFSLAPCWGPIAIATLAGTAVGTAADMMIGGAYCMSRNQVSIPLQPAYSYRPPPYQNWSIR